ncbi:MAG: glutamine synthetase family protein [Bacteroidetes bacterium]|nr:glutamine synthetase family protein [Bacteroidota bacterium]
MAKKNTNAYELNPNELVQFLKKPTSEFTKDDIINFIVNNNIEMVNFRYIAADGRLKTLNFVINSVEYLNEILTTGERVDGSSLFSFIEAGSSDLYVVPRYCTAFVNPFASIPTLDILCSYFDSAGNPLKSSPEYILQKAHQVFKQKTGLEFKALGELEYYIYADSDCNDQFQATDQRGYHESPPYTKFEHIRTEAMSIIASCGGQIKYGHSEVGNFTDGEYYYEQQEIEFLPCDPSSAVEQMLIAKWVLRQLCKEYELNISFAPKITVGKAGSGLHIHMMLLKNGKNIMLKNNVLSDEAKKMIAGVLDVSDALTAFGNTIPVSYLRLVPHQEAPTNICWGDRNRSVLVRVPLGWTSKTSMINQINPPVQDAAKYTEGRQTVEIRSGDGSADLYLYMAGILVAAQHGLTMKNAIEMANKLYVNVNIFKKENAKLLKSLNALPASCEESAEQLSKKRKIFEANDVFPEGLLDSTIEQLKSYKDKNLSEKLEGKTKEIRELVMKYIHIN